MDILWRILATLGLVALNGYFVAAEFAAVSARRSRLESLAHDNFWVRVSLQIKDKLDLYLSSCQLGVTLASLGLGAVTEPAVAGILAPLLEWIHIDPHHVHAISFAVAMAISTTLHIVIGEQAPKTWAIQFADNALPLLAPPLLLFTAIFYPAIWALNWVTRAVLRLSGMKLDQTHVSVPHTAQELRTLLEESIEQGAIPKGQERILASAFQFGDLKVRQIMTPRTQVDSLMLGQPLGQMLKVVQRSSFTRLPLCDGDLDHVVGLVHMKDLFVHLKLVPGKLRFSDDKTADAMAIAIADGKPGSMVHVIGSGEIDLNEVRRDILFVPALLPLPRLLRQFQNSHVHMAVVVDPDSGATLGIVTLEDVIEELVGDIDDEFDAGKNVDFEKDGENFRVAGSYPLRDLRDKLQLTDIDAQGDVDTVGGYITQELGRFPRAGDSIPIGEYTARVLGVQQRRVTQVLISPKTQTAMIADGPGEEGV